MSPMGYKPWEAGSEKRDPMKPAPQEPPSPRQTDAPIGEILTITVGYAGGGTTSFTRRAIAHKACYEEVFIIGRASTRSESTPITFGEKDEESILHPHDDALVITMQVANFTTWRILVDNESSADILF